MSSKTINADKTYRVRLSRPVEITPGHWARTGDEVLLAGALVTEKKDSIEKYEEA